MSISFETYQRVALEDLEGKWELVCGRFRRKPMVTMKHGRTARRLLMLVASQLGWRDWSVGQTRLRISSGTCYITDLAALPMSLVSTLADDQFEVYDQPLPLVAEVWSPSTDGYDVDAKLSDYQIRGDREIWRVDPYGHTVSTWRRQPDGTYQEAVIRGGIVRPVALPGVSIDLDKLFA